MSRIKWIFDHLPSEEDDRSADHFFICLPTGPFPHPQWWSYERQKFGNHPSVVAWARIPPSPLVDRRGWKYYGEVWPDDYGHFLIGTERRILGVWYDWFSPKQGKFVNNDEIILFWQDYNEKTIPKIKGKFVNPFKKF